MKYIVIPKSKIEEVSQEELDALHLSPRYSTDDTEVIIKLVHYDMLFQSPVILEVINGEEKPLTVYQYPTYEGSTLDKLLNTKEWTSEDVEL